MRQLARSLALSRARAPAPWQCCAASGPAHGGLTPTRSLRGVAARRAVRSFAAQASDDVPIASPSAGTAASSSRRVAFGEGSSGNGHSVSHRRLQEFLEAEISMMSRNGYSTITIEQVLMHGDPLDVAHLIQKELPARFATRIRQIENTTAEWRDIPALAEVHNMLRTSFCNLRLVDIDPVSLDAFTDVIVDLRTRHKPVVRLLAESAKDLSHVMHPGEINSWLGKFMRSRMGTEMLTNHYLRLFQSSDGQQVGIVDLRCNPAKVCKQAMDSVLERFDAQGVTMNLQVAHEIEFSFIPQYLYFMLEELLENSAAASVGIGGIGARRPGGSSEINVTVCADPRHVVFSISDKAGGIPYELKDKVWEYMFSTKPTNCEDQKSGQSAHFSAPGMGLPMCRLFTKYLGGHLHFMTMPGIGTDVYLYLHRIDAPPSGSIDGAFDGIYRNTLPVSYSPDTH